QRGGRIVVSTSTAGLHGGDGMAAYASSKAALIGLMRALAVEGKAYDLCVNAIAPYAATGMTRPFLHANLAATMPPEQVAPLVAWLAGPDCDVSGQTFVAGGGGLSAAFAVEGPRVELGASVGEAVHRALLARPWRAFDDSHAAFAEFLHPGVQFPA
ncbi:MAG TPA: SDR family NAD(P)-dependent oxidoreductase, partial [Candidatus Sulfopaludibacter sp.]|nr:SDR family NAD(P)-dependent oxidoreductase [Candidatus Sulfopaludibacter sp.]